MRNYWLRLKPGDIVVFKHDSSTFFTIIANHDDEYVYCLGFSPLNQIVYHTRVEKNKLEKSEDFKIGDRVRLMHHDSQLIVEDVYDDAIYCSSIKKNKTKILRLNRTQLVKERI